MHPWCHVDCRRVRGYPPPEKNGKIHRRSCNLEHFQPILRNYIAYFIKILQQNKTISIITIVIIMTYFVYFWCFTSCKFNPVYHHLYVKYLTMIIHTCIMHFRSHCLNIALVNSSHINTSNASVPWCHGFGLNCSAKRLVAFWN